MKLIKKSSLIYLLILLQILSINNSFSQSTIPSVYSNLSYENNKLTYYNGEDKLHPINSKSYYTIENLSGSPKGTQNGLEFDFNNDNFSGKLYYGFIPYGDSKHPYPIYFGEAEKIINGKASIDIKNKLSAIYDIVNWEETGKGTLGYRVVSSSGLILYDGRISFSGKSPFNIAHTIIEGPFVNLLKPTSVTISFKTNFASMAKVLINNNEFFDDIKTTNHKIKIKGLKSNTKYKYTVQTVGGFKYQYSLTTAPKKGSKQSFVFSYCSDSRSAQGGGERNIYGVNGYVLKKIVALSSEKKVSFMQITGDLIDGYLTDKDEMNLQYANWKSIVTPFAANFPINTAMGNHEILSFNFKDINRHSNRIDRFPFDSLSSEKIYADNFVNPLNGPISEDGAYYDPNMKEIDFPSYKENVYYYTYANTAIIVLNSNYLFAPELRRNSKLGGNLHAYIMDIQLNWLDGVIKKFESDSLIDNVFVTIHTPAFPNGGHVDNDMWYNGNNQLRPIINGKPVKKGIIERRDEFLNIIINKSTKVVALLTGDEHNYNKMRIEDGMPMYPKNWSFNKLKLKRTILQINNGAAGAPYYTQDATLWSDYVSGFTTQNAVVFIYVDGKNIRAKVINPDTLETIDEYNISE